MPVRHGVDRLAREAVVGAGSHGDAVLAVLRDEDQRRTGRGVLGREEGLGVDAVGGELLPEGCGAGVVAQTRDEGHVAAQACGRDGLVGPFAAVGLHEARLADGLARAGQVFDAGNHVDVGTAYYQNLVHVRLSLVNFCRFFALRGPDAAQPRGDAVFWFSGRPPIVPDAVSCRFAPVVFIGCLCRIRFLWGLWQMFGFRMLSF